MFTWSKEILAKSLSYVSKHCNKLSVDFISFGNAFQICGPDDLRLFEPKVT